jgi:transposase
VILLPRAVRVYVATAPTNLHLSFDGLANLVREVLRSDPLNGHVFIFLNRRRNQVKLLLWTRGGFTILHKRLEQGTFAFAHQVDANISSVQIDVHELALLLEGIAIVRARTSARWEPPAARG